MRALRIFLWIAIVGWAVGLGAKLFVVVIAGGWAASPPASFALLPYGRRYPIGWKSSVRLWLWVRVVAFLIIWALTPTVFWPMIHQLYGTSIGRITATDAESVQLAHRWFVWDWLRVCLIAIGFVASVCAISLPAATKEV